MAEKNVLNFMADDDDADDILMAEEGLKALAPVFIYEILTGSTNNKKTMRVEDLERRLDLFPYGLSMKRQALSRILRTMVQEGDLLGIHYDSRGGAYYDAPAFGKHAA